MYIIIPFFIGGCSGGGRRRHHCRSSSSSSSRSRSRSRRRRRSSSRAIIIIVMFIIANTITIILNTIIIIVNTTIVVIISYCYYMLLLLSFLLIMHVRILSYLIINMIYLDIYWWPFIYFFNHFVLQEFGTSKFQDFTSLSCPDTAVERSRAPTVDSDASGTWTSVSFKKSSRVVNLSKGG